MAANRHASARRTASDTSATQPSANVEDTPGASTSYDDPTEADLEQVMADLMSNDLPFSVGYNSPFDEVGADCGRLGPCGVASLPQSSWGATVPK